MAEPAVSVAAGAASVPVITVLGTAIGLQPGLLVAGALGAFASLVLLNSLPSDIAQPWWKSIIRRIAFMLASALVSAYATAVVMVLMSMPEPAQFGIAFTVGGSAQWVLQALIKRVTRTVEGAA